MILAFYSLFLVSEPSSITNVDQAIQFLRDTQFDGMVPGAGPTAAAAESAFTRTSVQRLLILLKQIQPMLAVQQWAKQGVLSGSLRPVRMVDVSIAVGFMPLAGGEISLNGIGFHEYRGRRRLHLSMSGRMHADKIGPSGFMLGSLGIRVAQETRQDGEFFLTQKQTISAGGLLFATEKEREGFVPGSFRSVFIGVLAGGYSTDSIAGTARLPLPIPLPRPSYMKNILKMDKLVSRFIDAAHRLDSAEAAKLAELIIQANKNLGVDFVRMGIKLPEQAPELDETHPLKSFETLFDPTLLAQTYTRATQLGAFVRSCLRI